MGELLVKFSFPKSRKNFQKYTIIVILSSIAHKTEVKHNLEPLVSLCYKSLSLRVLCPHLSSLCWESFFTTCLVLFHEKVKVFYPAIETPGGYGVTVQIFLDLITSWGMPSCLSFTSSRSQASIYIPVYPGHPWLYTCVSRAPLIIHQYIQGTPDYISVYPGHPWL